MACPGRKVNALRTTKATAWKFIAHGLKTTKVHVQNIQPVGIRVLGDIAFVHFHWTRIETDAEGKEKPVSGRWTNILKKQGDKRLSIGDHGGITSQE